MRRKIDSAAKAFKLSKSEIVNRALNAYLLRQKFYALRENLTGYAEKSGVYTDEDVFDRIS
jgi:hypothetical protein